MKTLPTYNQETEKWEPRESFSAMWSERLGAEIKARSPEPYPMEFHNGPELDAICAAINQRIDSHLEAVFFHHGLGEYGRNRIVIEPGSLHVLVRRLMDGNEHAESLASGICETLNLELI